MIPALLSLRGLGVRAILAALPALLRKQREERIYREYVTDCLRQIAENTAKYAGGQYPIERWADKLKQKPKEARTGEQIVADIIRDAGIKVVRTHGPV